MSDDEMPLTALAKPTKSKISDDVPLANLAAPGGGKRGRPSASGAAKPVAGAPQKPKPPPGKAQPRARLQKDESSSSSDSSSSSSDSSSDSAGGKKKAAKKRVKLMVNKKKDDGDDDADNKIQKKSRGVKEQVVVELLCRWWYALPDWPPHDPEGMAKKLAENNLRQVSIQEWEWVPETDEKTGRRKVYELTQFRGVFRASDGSKFDLRPMDSCPSLNNMMRKEVNELYGLLVKAYENQLKDLDNSKYDETDLRNKLMTALTKAREKAHQTNQMTFATGQKKPKLG